MTTSPEFTPQDVARRQADILDKPLRMAPLDEWTDEMRALVEFPPGYENAKPTMYGILLQNLGLFRASKDVITYFITKGRLAPRVRELGILRAAWMRQIPFVWGEHVKMGKAAGLTPEEIERVTEGSAAAGWNDADRTVLRAAEELVEGLMISDATWEKLAAQLDAADQLEFISMVGQYQALGAIQNSLRIPLFEGNPGLTAR
jgi:alkylhydroperoxidase family enzyme